MRAAFLAQPLRDVLQHDSLRNANASEFGYLVAVHDTRIDMRQQAGVLQQHVAHCGEIGQRRFMAEMLQLLARSAVSKLGLIAEREQCFVASGPFAGTRDSENLLGRQKGGLPTPRRFCKRTVVAHIAAQMRQRDENLSGVGNHIAMTAVAKFSGMLEQRIATRVSKVPPHLHIAWPLPSADFQQCGVGSFHDLNSVLVTAMFMTPVRAQRIHSEVTDRIAPHSVDMVGIARRVVIFHQ